MSVKQGKEKAPQIARRAWLAMVRLAFVVQCGLGKETKLSASLTGNEVGTDIPKETAGTFFMRLANLAMAKECKDAGKDYAKHSIVLKAESDTDTPRALGTKLNSTRNWYLQQFVRLADGFMPEIERDAFGNVPRVKISDDDGNIKPEFNGHYSQAQWPELEGVPEVSGRSTADDDLTDDDDYTF